MKKIEDININGKDVPVLISDEEEALLEAKLAGRASVAVLKSKDMDISLSRYAVLDENDIDEALLKRVAYRQLSLPVELIRDEDIIIREFCKEDFSCVSKFDRSKYSGKDTEIFYDKEAYEAYVDIQYDFYEDGVWAVERVSDKVLIGKAGLSFEDGKVYISYEIDKPYRRKGYAYKACKLLLDYAEKRFEITGIYARVADENKASKALARKIACEIEIIH